jgi:uncharacterized Zn-finger protein
MYLCHRLIVFVTGKKRKFCRDRQKSVGTEQDSPSSSLPPPTPSGGDSLSDREPFLMEVGTSPPEVEENDRGDELVLFAPSPTRSIFRTGGRDEPLQMLQQQPLLVTPVGVTSTPTPVIRSVISSRRREDQPLNLSLPSPSEPLSSILSSPSRRSESVHVSVIASTRRDRDEETGDPPVGYSVSSPSPSIYSGRSVRGSSGEVTPGAVNPISPVPSSSRDFHSISNSSAASVGGSGHVPNNFQGLLMAQGIAGPSTSISRGSRGPLPAIGPSSCMAPGPSGSGGGASSKRKLQCRDCGKEFSQLRNYRYHRSRHEGTHQFACTCPVCGKTFNDKGYLSSHLKIHRNAKEYKCEWCDKSFNQRVAYNMHVRIHTGHKPHKCDLCPKAFSRKMLLRQHMRTHTGERPYKCEICGKAFADRSNMLLHQVRNFTYFTISHSNNSLSSDVD